MFVKFFARRLSSTPYIKSWIRHCRVCSFCCCPPLRGEMAEQPAGEHRGGSSDTEQGLLIQPATPNSRGISSPSSGKASRLSLAATATGGKKPGYYSENGYFMELSRQERRRIQQEINKRFKPGEMKEKYYTICHTLMCLLEGLACETKRKTYQLLSLIITAV